MIFIASAESRNFLPAFSLLPDDCRFLHSTAMALPDNSDFDEASTPKLDEELTFSVLTLQARRKLLVALAAGGPQTGADLKHHGRGYRSCSTQRNFTDSTIKNLKLMVKAGVVLELDHPTDGRRVLYRLSPRVKVSREGDDWVFDFEFIVARLSVDGN
jgi:hypothetical protein